jgi:uncharacterized Zn finger protein
MVSIPLVTAQNIINYCGKKMYYSGKHFLNTKAFYVFYREWMVLKAVCEGTSNPSYLVKIIFDEQGISHSSCTCYSNKFAPCKHIAALLTMWQEDPAGFPERAQWVRRLSKVSKKDLIALLEKMVDLYPDNEDTYSSLIGQS